MSKKSNGFSVVNYYVFTGVLAFAYTTSLGSALEGLNIGGTLTRAYIILIAWAVVYGLVAKGARKLVLIEEVV